MRISFHLRRSLEMAHRRLRKLSGVHFAAGLVCVTTTVTGVIARLFIVTPLTEFMALRQRDTSEVRLAEERLSLRKNIDRILREIQDRKTTMDAAFIEDGPTRSIEHEVVRMTDGLRRARLQLVSVTREPIVGEPGSVTLVATFEGSFDNVGIFLSSFHSRTLVGLRLLDAEFVQAAQGQLSVKLSWSFRAVTRPRYLCLSSQES